MKIRFSEKIIKETNARSPKFNIKDVINNKLRSKKVENSDSEITFSKWSYFLPVLLFLITISLTAVSLVDLQIVKGAENYQKTINNQISKEEIPAYRGAILDRNGMKLAHNIPSINIVLDLSPYRVNGLIKKEEILASVSKVEKLIASKYWKSGNEGFESLEDKVTSILENMTEYDLRYSKKILLASGVDNETAVNVKSKSKELVGIVTDDGFKRNYPLKDPFTHILGYTGDVYAEDLERLDYVDINDNIGKAGVERFYDRELIGDDGYIAREVDALGQRISDDIVDSKDPVSGSTLVLSIDSKAQTKLYEILKKGVAKYGATGGAGILQDVNTGEIISIVSYPSYDNNLFIGGISSKEFSKLLNDKRGPLNNKAIGAQVPPGSTFKTLVAAAALDGGAINTSTQYVSRSNYTFSNGAKFQEYRNNAYGTLNINDAISVSSNIFFCETIRNWDINKLVPYLTKFGIGEYTGIDIPGEGKGMLPSPANKINLAKTTSPWLDPVWYPEGDSCNSAIGQGITTVTPIQMVNWVGAIANGGKLLVPHVAKSFISPDGTQTDIETRIINQGFVKQSSLEVVRLGMWSAVNGPRKSIYALSGGKVVVAAKTGTAEFGRVNSKGIYEHTHAWVTGFFPYEKPKYSFVIFLEDGGESYNSANLAREFIDWYVTKR